MMFFRKYFSNLKRKPKGRDFAMIKTMDLGDPTLI